MHSKKKILILTILFTTNNILYSLTDLSGNNIFWTSLGIYKNKGVKKLTSTSTVTSTKNLIQHIHNLSYKYVYIKLKGFNKNKKLVLRCLNNSFLTILLISDKTSFPHNGCKKPRIKRL